MIFARAAPVLELFAFVEPRCSCAAIEVGENALASDFLQRAETLGRENDLDEDDIAVLKCQRAYLECCSGNQDAAIASFKVGCAAPAPLQPTPSNALLADHS